MFKRWCSIVFWYVYQRVNLIFLWGPTLYPFLSWWVTCAGAAQQLEQLPEAPWPREMTEYIADTLSLFPSLSLSLSLYLSPSLSLSLSPSLSLSLSVSIYLYYNMFSGWWFGTWISFFLSIGNNHPNWLIFFRGVGIPPTSINWQLEYQSKTFKPSRKNASCLLIANNIGMPPLCEGRRPPTYVYNYIYIYTYLSIICICVHTHIIYIHVICMCWYIYIYVYVYVFMYMYICICIFVHVYLYMCICIFV